ncbi:MAG: transposase [Gammaproteobacteria bacterium]|nr:transposase [Gammaproteobacteria bacterium]MXY64491.1 ISL3 family transposase [Gammaproteobacteria bacterium]MYG65143.1 ISL3 family transposase [Gammaproteobacteria bacterium]
MPRDKLALSRGIADSKRQRASAGDSTDLKDEHHDQKEQCNRLFGIEFPWAVTDVEIRHEEQTVKVHVSHDPGHELTCPQCGAACRGYDRRPREWRHLDTCQYRTILAADVPWVECPGHGMVTVPVPWAEPLPRFTMLFESVVIEWLKEASTSAVARGLARRQERVCAHIGVDETSFRKHHDYVRWCRTRGKGRCCTWERTAGRQETLEGWYRSLTPAQLAGLESVSMDMWPAYIHANLEQVPEGEEKVAFDKLHLAKHLGDAVDKVRRQEHRALMREGCEDLKGSQYDWLTNPANMSRRRKSRFQALRDSTLKTARAWAIKKLAMSLWHYSSRTWAEKGWKRWLSWAVHCRLEPVKQAARTIRNLLWGILNAVGDLQHHKNPKYREFYRLLDGIITPTYMMLHSPSSSCRRRQGRVPGFGVLVRDEYSGIGLAAL